MVVFWLLAVLMTALALAFVLVPLLRGRAAAGPGALEANLAVLRGQRHEIEADVANGVLAESERDEALSELVERARDDLASHEPPPSPRSSKPWIAVAAAAVAVPAIAFGIYAWLGAPGALAPPELAHEAGKLDDQQIEAMVDKLARKVRQRPDDARGWALLARSLAAIGRYDESADAYQHLNELVPDDPAVLSDYADALGMAQGRSLAGRPYELVKKALALDPHHRKALALAGTAAMDAGDYAAALGYWQSLAATTEPGSQDEQDVLALLDELRQKAAAAGKPLPAAGPIARSSPPANMAKAPAPPAAPAATPGQALTGSVSIAPAVAAKMNPSDTLFVFARAENGPRMPLAVVRTSAASLPLKFSLDDSMAMAPTARLSGAAAVRIEARISRSGNALPQPGDLVGASGVVKPDARDVKIVIDKVVPIASSSPPATLATTPAAPAATPGQALTGSVSIAPAVAAKMNPSDTLFVFARAENGPRMPLAVVRTSAASLPLKFSLDDSMAMAPTARLSGAAAVRIEARISRSGNALPQPGDLVGASGVVKPDARDVKIVIDKVVP